MIKIERYPMLGFEVGLNTTDWVWFYKGLNTKTGIFTECAVTMNSNPKADKAVRKYIREKLKEETNENKRTSRKSTR